MSEEMMQISQEGNGGNQSIVWQLPSGNYENRTGGGMQPSGPTLAQHLRHASPLPHGVLQPREAPQRHHLPHTQVTAPHVVPGASDPNNGQRPTDQPFVIDFGSVFDPTSANVGSINLQSLQQMAPEHFQLANMGGHDENQNTGPQNNGQHGHQHVVQGMDNMDWSIFLLNSLLFIIILVIRIVSDHLLGMLVFVGLGGTFFYANMFFKKIVHESSLRDAMLHNVLLSYFWIVMFLTANIGCVYYVFQEQELWNVLMFQLPAKWDGDIWIFFWAVCVNDFVLKYVTVIIKAFFSMAPIKPKNRGKYYMFVEHVMQLYRMVIPIVPWFHFLSDGLSWVFAAGLLCFYFLCKGYQLFFKARDVRNAFLKLLREKTYGIKPNSSDLKTRGDGCPICQDDYKDPVMLDCKHIFCDDCVAVWFDREKTCPMCRAQIHTDNSMWKDGSTSIHVQWY
ncbi:RING finger and transmembrane domain-containing protein 2-like [Mizuhopecten yessoensis]|uniref:RING finger and transmembrane domain-containing protein 2 n=1 Tax=Mizuhopecten yessoensis TaxID=6573 RepID=A0A210R328_MIZYE|nr:RING finger and transmembrane domain-containing protein 2-like [Mizuhopecten yessoensis]XP_021371032.1 RING finger and transmembrane domain-containing protein 2-like [Mizuhopecten yessoensis]OWF55281.1 RING finger and transmembrane domain-containing protein 2 [Mizuhopecten yessoensis]